MTQVVRRGDTEYELGPCLGKGGFGVCYKAVEKNNSPAGDRVVALKRINKQMVNEAAKEPYLRYEIALHSQLQHPNVVELYITFSTSDSIYFVLEYCNKKSLADIIVRYTTLAADLAAYYFRQMVSGLKYLHGQQILHRDLKLSNILVDTDDTVKISDFGLSCTKTRGYLERHLACGTPNYLSPEVLLRQGHTTKSDVWSCGVVLYAVFGGVPPFQDDDILEIYRNIVTCSYHFTQYHCDDQLKDLVSRLLQLNPEERPDLDDILGHQFTLYGEQYKSQLTKEQEPVTTSCSSLGKMSGVKSLSKSLTTLFVKSSKDSESLQKSRNGSRNRVEKEWVLSRVPRSFTVVDVKLLRTTSLLEHLRARPAWNKRSTEFQSGWLTWWRDKIATVGFYYQLSTGYNCALYNDAACCLHDIQSACAYFINLNSPRRMHRESCAKPDEVNKFYEPMLQDVLQEFQDVTVSNQYREQLSWVSHTHHNKDKVNYLCRWSMYRGGTYHVFYMSDESIQINFGQAFLLRICGRLCYFYQPIKRGFVVETKSIDSWCFQDINAELVDVLCDIFLSKT